MASGKNKKEGRFCNHIISRFHNFQSNNYYLLIFRYMRNKYMFCILQIYHLFIKLLTTPGINNIQTHDM